MTRSTSQLLCRYGYDPLDRLTRCSPLDHHQTHCFYHLNRLSTEIQGAVQTSWLQTPDRLLAQQRLEASHRKGALLATDAPGSVVHLLSDQQQQGFAYLPYGLRHPDSASLLLPGFNGERLDPVTGHYLLGNGYRAFNPVLMRFNSPDSLSPFGEGGLNAYAYCAGDPVNRVDPTGHFGHYLRAVMNWLNEPPPTSLIHMIDDGLFAFEKPSRKGRTLAILGHGDPVANSQGYHLMGTTQGIRVPPDALIQKVTTAGIDLRPYDKLRLMMCHSASGETISYASELSRLTRKPVTGYKGPVDANIAPEDLMKLIHEKSHKLRKLSGTTFEYTGEIKVNKTNPYFFLHPEHASFTHQPETFRNYSPHYAMV